MLNREVTGIYDMALRPLGVKVSQINVLTAVAKLQPETPRQIAELLRIEKSTLSRNGERMRARGWIRILSGDDGRSHRLEITANGRRLFGRRRRSMRSFASTAPPSVSSSRWCREVASRGA